MQICLRVGARESRYISNRIPCFLTELFTCKSHKASAEVKHTHTQHLHLEVGGMFEVININVHPIQRQTPWLMLSHSGPGRLGLRLLSSIHVVGSSSRQTCGRKHFLSFYHGHSNPRRVSVRFILWSVRGVLISLIFCERNYHELHFFFEQF